MPLYFQPMPYQHDETGVGLMAVDEFADPVLETSQASLCHLPILRVERAVDSAAVFLDEDVIGATRDMSVEFLRNPDEDCGGLGGALCLHATANLIFSGHKIGSQRVFIGLAWGGSSALVSSRLGVGRLRGGAAASKVAVPPGAVHVPTASKE